jgi:hypothetical protein
LRRGAKDNLKGAVMSIDWTMLVATVVAFLVALGIQSLLQARIRIASTGIILAIGITNALLTAILATVIIVR